ncbi:MAG: hypothetical protein NDJ89_04490 [Oligoflexia bacterium]|nr:hypothetical protein [Oligoflexia bacterium]
MHLPIHHPDFRYPESRNPYWKKLQSFAGKVFSDNETERLRGSWRQAFPQAAAGGRLHVEIGCNAAHVLLEWANRNPGDAYIGIDWKYKPIFWAAEKAAKRGIGNALFFRAHAERLHYMFGPGEIDRLYVYFPDPWPRKKQWKNRFVTVETLTAFAPLLKADGIFHLKTDHPGYFEWMEDAVARTSDLWSVLERTDDLHQGHPDPTKLAIPEVTLFERLFIRDGLKIHSLKLQPKAPPPVSFRA